MIIDLLTPFTDDYDRAYLVNSQNRNSVCLYNTKDKSRKTISYAKYLLSHKLNRYLLSDEEADHIDNDPTNDSIDNLQILSPSENCIKYRNHVGKSMVEYSCPICDKVFSVRRGQSHLVKKSKNAVACSRVCSGKLTHSSMENKIRFIREYKKHS